jgi:hypothetical protein
MGNMKTFYKVAIKKDYTELEFDFESYEQMDNFIKMIIEFSDYEVGIKKAVLPFSESEEEA